MRHRCRQRHCPKPVARLRRHRDWQLLAIRPIAGRQHALYHGDEAFRVATAVIWLWCLLPVSINKTLVTVQSAIVMTILTGITYA